MWGINKRNYAKNRLADKWRQTQLKLVCNEVQVDVTVPARTWIDDNGDGLQTPTATCGVPHLYSHGQLSVTLTVKEGFASFAAQEMRFKGYVSVIWGTPRLNTKYDLSDIGINFTYVTNKYEYVIVNLIKIKILIVKIVNRCLHSSAWLLLKTILNIKTQFKVQVLTINFDINEPLRLKYLFVIVKVLSKNLRIEMYILLKSFQIVNV